MKHVPLVTVITIIEGVCGIKGLKWLLMQCQILLVIHKWIQGNLERESGNLSEVTQGFSPGTPAVWSDTP